MSSPAAAGLRHVRAAVVAIAIVTLSASGHVAGGGDRPHPLGLLVLASVFAVPAYLAGRSQLRFTSLLGLLGIGQVVVHQVLGDTSRLAPSLHHAHATADPATAAMSPDHMLAGHAAATLLLAAALAYGEAVLWGVWRWLHSALHWLRPTTALVVGAPPWMPASHDPAPASTLHSRGTAPPRAPPLRPGPLTA